MAISLNNHEQRIKDLESKVSNLQTQTSSGKIQTLWTGSHWMDGGSALTLSNYDFNTFSTIVVSCNTDDNDTDTGGWRNCCLYCPTAKYGARSGTVMDLTGDDWAGAWLRDNHSIIPQAGGGVWIRAVYGIK